MTKDKKDSEISQLKNEIQNLKHILKSYEDQALKLSDLEKKLRNQNTKHEKEMKTLEDKYKEKIKAFSNKLTSYEEMLKFNTTFKTLKKDKGDEDDLDRVNVKK
jgi:predicted  nucleic acid-binding Zn-ribbon protein